MSGENCDVLLGVCDEEITDGSTVDFTVSKIGGLPDVAGDKLDHWSCVRCGRLLYQVVQLYCPLSQSPYHRTLYVFTCVNKTCWNKAESWKVIRSQVLDASFQTPSRELQPTSGSASHTPSGDSGQKDTTRNDWCDDADDWGVDAAWDNPSPVSKTSQDNLPDHPTNPAADDWCDDADDWGDGISDVQTPGGANDRDDRIMVTQTPGVTAVDAVRDCGREENGIAEDVDIISHDMSTLLRTSEASDPHLDIATVNCGQANEADRNCEHPERSCDPAAEKSCHMIHQEAVNISSVTEQFRSYYLNVYDEPESAADDLNHAKRLLRDYSKREGVDIQRMADEMDGVGGAGEAYEKSETKHGDKLFYKFMKRVAICPSQCIRYCREGEPLLMQQAVGVKPRACPFCGGRRVFELQIMPALVTLLTSRRNTGAQVEFGTVLVYTCVNSCWDDSSSSTYREEMAFLQSDPDDHLFK